MAGGRAAAADGKARRSRSVGSLEGLHSPLLSSSLRAVTGLRSRKRQCNGGDWAGAGAVAGTGAATRTGIGGGDAGGRTRERSGAERLRRGRVEGAGGASSSITQSSSSEDRNGERFGRAGDRGMVAVEEAEEGRESAGIGRRERPVRRGPE